MVTEENLDYLFGIIEIVQKNANLLTKDNVDEYKPKILRFIDTTLSWRKDNSKNTVLSEDSPDRLVNLIS